jgi:hypothetical protein
MNRFERVFCMLLVGVLWSATWATVASGKPPKKKRVVASKAATKKAVAAVAVSPATMHKNCTPNPSNLALSYSFAGNGTVTFSYDMKCITGDGPCQWWANVQIYAQHGAPVQMPPYSTIYTGYSVSCDTNMGYVFPVDQVNIAGSGAGMYATGTITKGANILNGGTVLESINIQFTTPISAVIPDVIVGPNLNWE